MSERETITKTTPIDSYEVVLKSWLTGREQRQIRSVLLEGVKFSASPETEKENEEEDQKDKSSFSSDFSIDGSSIDKQQDAKIKAIVVSVDGQTDNVLDKILDMHSKDMDFIINEIEKISDSLDETTKKK